MDTRTKIFFRRNISNNLWFLSEWRLFLYIVFQQKYCIDIQSSRVITIRGLFSSLLHIQTAATVFGRRWYVEYVCEHANICKLYEICLFCSESSGTPIFFLFFLNFNFQVVGQKKCSAPFLISVTLSTKWD